MRREIKRSTVIISLIMVFMICIAMSVMPLPGETAHAASIGKVSKLSAKMVNTYASLSWSGAKNAKKYQVYCASSQNGKYKLVKTVTAKKCKVSIAFGLSYYKVRGVSSSGKVKGSFSTAKPVYGALGTSQKYNASYSSGQTKIQVTIMNGSTNSSKYSSNQSMYMMGKKSSSSMYTWSIIFKNKSTGKTVKTYRAYHCNSMGTVATLSQIGKNVTGNVLCATWPGTVIPDSYFNNYNMIVKAPFALSSNINSGKAFYIYCGDVINTTDTTRWR